MTTKYTPAQMEKVNTLRRVRTEGSILRAMWLNEVLPAVEEEIDRRIAAGESVALSMPDIDRIGAAFIQDFLTLNPQLPE